MTNQTAFGKVWAPTVGLGITVAGFITLAFLGVDLGVYTAYAATVGAAGAGAVFSKAVASRRQTNIDQDLSQPPTPSVSS